MIIARPVICDCCQTPVLELDDTYVVIRSKHHGERHVTRISLVHLVALTCRQGLDTNQKASYTTAIEANV